MLICCRFVRESFLKRYRRQPTDAKINAELQSMRKKRYSLNQANSIRNDMWVIAEEIKRENLKKRAEAGALARWKKEKIGY